MKRRWQAALGLALLPAALGLLTWRLGARLGWLPDSVLYLRISLGYLALGAGLLVSGLLVSALALAWRQERRWERRLASQQAEAAARRRQFLLRLDHELKNPLTSLQVELANLEADESPLSAGQAQTAGRLHEQVQRLSELVVQLRKLAELETRPIEAEDVDLAALLGELVAEFQAIPTGQARPISLNLPTLPWPLPHVQGDPDLLYLALRNILDNAVKFSRPGDEVQVRAFEDARDVIVEIADGGPGIPPEEQELAWEELFRGQARHSEPGSGLGLALVRAIVERHGGQASLRSRPGQGTVVTLRLPARL